MTGLTGDDHMLTGAYAVDALEDDVERRRFERHLTECSACRDEVRALRETAAVLAGAVGITPPPALKARVLAQIATTPQLPPTTSSRSSGRRSSDARPVGSARPRAGWRVAAAAAVVLAGGGLAGAGGVQLYRAHSAQQQADRILAIAADPTARRVSGAVTGGGTATVVVAGGQAALITTGVPALADDRAYQLWLVRPGGTVSAGLGPDGAQAAGRWSRLLDGVRSGDAVAISVEPRGGSRQPTTTPLTVLEV